MGIAFRLPRVVKQVSQWAHPPIVLVQIQVLGTDKVNASHLYFTRYKNQRHK